MIREDACCLHSCFRQCDLTAAGDLAAAADLAGVSRALKQQAGVRSLAPLKDALALLAQVHVASQLSHPQRHNHSVCVFVCVCHNHSTGFARLLRRQPWRSRHSRRSAPQRSNRYTLPSLDVLCVSHSFLASWSKSNCLLKPMLATTLSSLQERGKAALKHFTEGQVMPSFVLRVS